MSKDKSKNVLKSRMFTRTMAPNVDPTPVPFEFTPGTDWEMVVMKMALNHLVTDLKGPALSSVDSHTKLNVLQSAEQLLKRLNAH